MIRVVCGCGRVFQAEDRHAGKRTRCPACGSGLLIGKPASSVSGEPGLQEVPSWWYPGDSSTSGGAGRVRPGEGDPDAIRTTILEHGNVPKEAQRGWSPDDGRRMAIASSPPGGPGRSLRTLAWAAAASVAMALGVACWMWGTIPIVGKPTAAPSPRAVPSRDPIRPPDLPDDGPFPARDRGTEDGRPPRTARRLRLLVPAYFYPGGDGLLQWRHLIDAAAKVDVVAVVNVSSGPGVERNPAYTAIIAEAADRGVKLVGYVNTEYAARPASEVKAEVDAWVRLYPRVAGVFLDQQPAEARHAAYIADISRYARQRIPGGLVVTDPGVPCDEAYLARRASDVVCVFSHSDYSRFELPANLKEFDPSHFSALVYQVADVRTMRPLLREAIIKRIGYIYVTDGKAPNPWARLPSYWAAEVEAVRQIQ
jgi:Spherulation-specific family 4